MIRHIQAESGELVNPVERMWELLERDHGGCEEEGCSLADAMANGCDESLELWYQSGAACNEFNRLYESTFQVKEYSHE